MQTTWENQHQSFERWGYGVCWSNAHPHSCSWGAHWGFVGAALSEAFFNALNSKKVELLRQRRIEIEKECRESIRQLEMYHNQFKEVFERYFHGTIKFFNESFDELERALYAGDADLVIGANNKIQEGLGQKALFGNKQECWEFHH